MSRDLRRYAQQTRFRVMLGGLLILFFVGDGLIYLFYGGGAAVTGLICLLLGLLPLVLIGLILSVMGWFVNRVNRE
jgi:hypothetical protein